MKPRNEFGKTRVWVTWRADVFGYGSISVDRIKLLEMI